MVNRKSLKIFLTLVLFGCLFYSYQVEANEGAGFSIELELPKNQKKGPTQYFDLNALPDEKQIVTLYIVNDSSNVEDFDLVVTNAATNSRGVIEYANKDATKQVLEHRRLTEITSIQEKVTVKKGESQAIKIEIDHPKNSYEGVILGGIHLSPNLSEMEKKNPGYSNLFTRSVAIQLNGSELDKNFYLKLQNMEKDNDAEGFTINNLLTNKAPILLKNTKLNQKIINKKSKKIIFEENQKVDIAPSADFYLPIMLDEKLSSGLYEMILTFENEEGDRRFNQEIRQTFKIDGEQVILVHRTWYWLFILIIILLLIYIAYRKYKEKETLDEPNSEDNLQVIESENTE